MAFRAIFTAALAGVAVAGIYPDDHWDYATKLENDADFDAAVSAATEGDHTLFVRWIASEG
jgi:hypothetical protein